MADLQKGLFAILALTVPVLGQQESCDSFPEWSPRIYTIATGHDWGAYEYFDESGYISGFSTDIINAVCDAAGIQCRTIWDKYSNCLTSNPGEHIVAGPGLLGKWYDACTGWKATVDRIHIFDFSYPFLEAVRARFFVLNSNPNNFDPSDLAGKKIGFMRGWSFNEKCLARHDSDPGRSNYILSQEQIVYVEVPGDSYPLLVDGTMDAMFINEDAMTAYIDRNQIEMVGDGLASTCAIAGNGMMTRKDNDFISHWNRGFQILRSTGKFYKLCQQANQDHAERGEVNCVQ